jgi:hypothetical protein
MKDERYLLTALHRYSRFDLPSDGSHHVTVIGALIKVSLKSKSRKR